MTFQSQNVLVGRRRCQGIHSMLDQETAKDKSCPSCNPVKKDTERERHFSILRNVLSGRMAERLINEGICLPSRLRRKIMFAIRMNGV